MRVCRRTCAAAGAPGGAEGADVIDIGGVKAGPGEEVDAATEAQRVVGMIGWIREQYPTYSSASTPGGRRWLPRRVPSGADLINDTWAGADPELVSVAATMGRASCSHTGGARVRTRPHRVAYDDVVADARRGDHGPPSVPSPRGWPVTRYYRSDARFRQEHFPRIDLVTPNVLVTPAGRC